MRHLDAQALRELAAREPQAVAWFREHLAHPCEPCEDFLAEVPGPGLLDGQVDGLLLRLAPPREQPPVDAHTLARLRRALRQRQPGRRTWLAASAATALAAGLAALLLLPHSAVKQPAPAAWDGVKGMRLMNLELTVVARGPDGQLRRLDPGATASESEVLVLRYHATEAGEAFLFQQRAGQPPEQLGRFHLDAGTHELAGPEGLLGVSLQGESGPLSLWLVAFPPGHAPSEQQVRAALTQPQTVQSLSPALKRFDLSVQRGQNRD